MTLYALADLDDAFDARRAFLTPVEWRRWARLAVLAVPAGLLGAVGVALLALAAPVGLLFLGVVALLFVAAAVTAVVQVPVQTDRRYDALFVLGDVTPDDDVVPDQRAAVRGWGRERDPAERGATRGVAGPRRNRDPS